MATPFSWRCPNKNKKGVILKIMDRLFLAVPALLFDYEKIKRDFSDLLSGRWTPCDNLHVTLYHFGDRFESTALVDKLIPLVSQIEASDIIGLEYFARSNILYAKSANASLETLYTRITEEFGLSAKSAFIPHVTLMRIKKIESRELFEQKLRVYNKHVIGSLAPEVQLMQSHLYSDGARYELIKRFGI